MFPEIEALFFGDLQNKKYIICVYIYIYMFYFYCISISGWGHILYTKRAQDHRMKESIPQITAEIAVHFGSYEP